MASWTDHNGLMGGSQWPLQYLLDRRTDQECAITNWGRRARSEVSRIIYNQLDLKYSQNKVYLAYGGVSYINQKRSSVNKIYV